MEKLTDSRIRDHFLGWQCRVRQFAMRQHGGRPIPPMCPRVLYANGEPMAEALIVLIVPRLPKESTAFFRFQVQKTVDPRVTYERGLDYLSSTFFQRPELFRDEMTALFQPGSALAATLLAAGEVILDFDGLGQSYKMICRVRKVPRRDGAHAATVWHNRIFNPAIPADAIVLGFAPDWSSAQAHPEP
ncbi:MAG: hypothetical protein R3D33_16725 [Hyphomicrobiaceae bacterium]